MSTYDSFIEKEPPTFCLQNQDNKKVCLEDFKGKWILVYFYPKDHTPGCTIEACQIRDFWKDLSDLNVVVLGISKDTVRTHKNFATKHELPFDLLADTDREVIEKYKCLKPKKMFGKEVIGTHRNSFLINPDFKVVKVYEGVKPNMHAKEVLDDVKELS